MDGNAVASAPPTPTLISTKAVASSSHKPDWHGYTFVDGNLVDGNLGTSWQPTSKGGLGEWINITFPGEFSVTTLEIANGFQTHDFGDQFLLNSRIRTATVTLDDGTRVSIAFAPDARGYVRFDLGGKKTGNLRIVVEAAYPGTKWDDLAVSEIRVIGAQIGNDDTANRARDRNDEATSREPTAHAPDNLSPRCKNERRDKKDGTFEVVKKCTSDATTAYKMGLQQFARGDSNGALATFEALLATDPDFAPTWRGVGLVYEQLGDKLQAVTAFKRYLQLSPNASDADQIRSRLEKLGS